MLLERVTKPFGLFTAIEAASGAFTSFFTVAVLVLCNSSLAHPFANT